MSRADRGAEIQRARERARLTQLELALAVDISMRTLGRVEAGQGAQGRTLDDLEYYLRLRDEQPLNYRGKGRVSLPPPTVRVPEPPPVPRALGEYTETELLAELLRRAAERNRP